MTVMRWLVFSVLLLVAAGLMAAAITPAIRQRVQSWLSHSGRTVLATAEGDLLGDGQPIKAIKIREGDEIFVEIVRVLPSGATEPIDRVTLPDRHDGLFNFRGHITRLAITDVDGDNRPELLAPSFDGQLVPHLNVFRYNPATSHFEPVESGVGIQGH